MRTVLIHTVGLLATLGLYCLVIPQARRDLVADSTLTEKITGLGVRAFCIYVCFLFVYYAVFASRSKSPMPEQGAYGGYADTDPDPAGPADRPDDTGGDKKRDSASQERAGG